MANRSTASGFLAEKPDGRRSGKSPSRSPAPNARKQQKPKVVGYTSEGVRDNDIFSLPGSDWQMLALLIVVAAVVRLYRIYQPSSVVFDEVQYVRFACALIASI
jgi:dolichyl-phosphate-mannose-protein mannosyltransferase